MINWANELKKIRASSGLSQQKWAEKIDVPQKTWSNYENGRTVPKMGFLFALAEKGYTIPGLTTPLREDIARLSGEPLQKVDERMELAQKLAPSMDPNAPPEVLGKAVNEALERSKYDNLSHLRNVPVEEISAMPEVRLANLESKVSSMEFRLTHIETLLQRMLPQGEPKTG